MRLHIIGLVWYGNNNKNTNCRQPVIMLHINIHNISEWLLMTIRYQYSAAINFSTVAVSLHSCIKITLGIAKIPAIKQNKSHLVGPCVFTQSPYNEKRY